MAERLDFDRFPLPGATRYEFMRAMPTVRQNEHWDGWKVEAFNANGILMDTTLPGDEFTPDDVIPALTSRSWVVARWAPQYHIRAWRGDRLPVTRIDFLWTNEGRWRVRKWLAGWMAKTDPTSDELKPADWDADTAFAWLLAHAPEDHLDPDGWRMQRAGNFVRAWKGPVQPVRNPGQISRMRDAVRTYRNALATMMDNPWIIAERPEWMPESLGLGLEAIQALDFAYML